MNQALAQNSWHFDEGAYDTSLITGALLWPDMRKLSQAILEGVKPVELRKLVVEENILQRKRSKTSLNIFSYLLQRISASPNELIKLIAEADSITSRQAALLASLNTSRFLREFFSSVVCDRLESFSPILPPLFFEDFWNSCLANDRSLHEVRPKTVKEIRSILLKFLVEIEALESSRTKELKAIRFNPQVAAVLKQTELNWLTPSVRSFIK